MIAIATSGYGIICHIPEDKIRVISATITEVPEVVLHMEIQNLYFRSNSTASHLQYEYLFKIPLCCSQKRLGSRDIHKSSDVLFRG